MDLNGHDPLSAAIEQAKQQQAQEQMLQHALQQALNQPVKVTRITGPHATTVATDENGNQMLLVATITGERIDIPVDAATAKRIAYAFATSGPQETSEDQGTAGSHENPIVVETAETAE